MTKSEQQRWALGEWVKAHHRRGWFPYQISLERKRTLSAYGGRWRVRHHVDVVGPKLYAFLSVGPLHTLRISEERRLRGRDAYTKIELIVRNLGYSGGWHMNEQINGHWRRPLQNALLAHEELSFLERLHFPGKGRLPDRKERPESSEVPIGIIGSPSSIRDAWRFFALAKAQRPHDCHLRTIGFQQHGKQSFTGNSWQSSLSVSSYERRLDATFIPTLVGPSADVPDKRSLRQLERGFQSLKMRGGWYTDKEQPVFGAFYREGPITPERFAAEQAFLESIRLTDVMKLGAEPQQRPTKTRRASR